MQLKYGSYFKLPAAGGPYDRGQSDSYGTDLLTLTAVAMTTSCGGRFKLKISGENQMIPLNESFYYDEK